MSIPDNKFVPASELAIREFNSLRGKLCALIETMDLPHSQERAIIGLIKQYSYESQEVVSQLFNTTNNAKVRYNSSKIEFK